MKTSPEFEAFLARVYVDAEFRARFLADPLGEAGRAGLSAAEGAALQQLDLIGLELAAGSYQAKRGKKRKPGWFRRLIAKTPLA